MLDTDIGGDELASIADQLLDLAPEVGFEITEHHCGTVSDEQLGDGLADAAGAAGDDRDLALERQMIRHIASRS